VQIADSSQHAGDRVLPSGPDNDRFDQLEQLVSELRQELERLEARIGQLESTGAA
jgi:ubiquinone biosynthesis protein UbiJ